MRNHRRQDKRQGADERQEAHDKLTTEQKVAKLYKKLGKGLGATKERAKLAKD